jgi:hypothetical protein
MSLTRSTPVISGYASRNIKNIGHQRFVLARLDKSGPPLTGARRSCIHSGPILVVL